MTNLFFAPNNKKHGDFSIIEKDRKLYSIFIENVKSESAVKNGLSNKNSFGLSVSEDGLNWKYLGKIMSPGSTQKNTWKNQSLWAMQVIKNNINNEGKYLMIYSAIAQHKGLIHPTQQFGIAYSDNLKEWKDHPENPVIKNTDTGEVYYPKEFHRFCWRDANIIKHNPNKKTLAILSATDITKPYEHSGCTALIECNSTNLDSWTPKKPIFSPEKYNEIETPHMHEIISKSNKKIDDKKKFILIFGENAQKMNMRFALSNNLLGPYKEPKLNVFTPAQCYAGVLVDFKEKTFFYHWIMDKIKGKNERYLAPPKEAILKEDFLFLKKHPKLDSFFTEKKLPSIHSEEIINLTDEIKNKKHRIKFITKIKKRMLIELRSDEKGYSRDIYINLTKHGITVRDFTLDDLFNDSRTIPQSQGKQHNTVNLELFVEDKFLEIYANGFLIYSIILSFDLKKIQKVHLKSSNI